MELAAFLAWGAKHRGGKGFDELKSQFDQMDENTKGTWTPSDPQLAIDKLGADRRYSSLVQLCVAQRQAPQQPQPSALGGHAADGADETAIAFIKDWGAALSQNNLLTMRRSSVSSKCSKPSTPCA